MSGAYTWAPSPVPVALTAVLMLAFGTGVLARRVTGVS